MHNNNQRRQRPRGHQGGGHNNRRPNNNSGGGYSRNQTFDSNGPDVRVRGTAQQVYEKYLNSARDASAVGDHIRAENLLQHAEHYFRILGSIQESWQAQNEQPRVENYPAPQEDGNSELPAFIQGSQQPPQQQGNYNNPNPRQHRPRGGYIPPAAQPSIPDAQPSIENMGEPFTNDTDRAVS